MKMITVLLTLLVALILLLSACAPKAAPVAAPSAPAPQVAPSVSAAPAPARAAWEEEWQRTLAAAQREGSVVVYAGGSGPTVRAAMVVGVKSRFGISVEWLAGRGSELAEKILSARRAGLYLVDAYLGGTTTMYTQLKPAGALDSLEPLLFLPEVLDPKVWWGGKGIRWLDKEHYAVAATSYASPGILVNTEMVKTGEIKGYRDLLNPKWRGKIVINDPTLAGTGGKRMGVIGDYLLGWDFVRELAKQEPIIVRDQRLMVEWVARGKYPVLLGYEPEIVTEFKKAGAPLVVVAAVEGDYVSSGTGALTVLNRRPHPDAAKLFVNWLLSKEGSTILSQAVGVPASRLDVSREGLDPWQIPDPNINYIWSDTEDFNIKQPEAFKLAKEIFGPLMK